MATVMAVSWTLAQRGLLAWNVWDEAVQADARNAWLKEQCSNRTFYLNIRVHSTICEDLMSAKAPLIQAIDVIAASNTAWCGLAAIAVALTLVKMCSSCNRTVFTYANYISPLLPT